MIVTRTLLALTAIVGLGIASCSAEAAVDVDSRVSTRLSDEADDTVPATTVEEAPTTSDAASDDSDPGTDEALVLAAGDVTVTISLRRTVAPAPPGGLDAFAGAVVAADGSVLAHGFDDLAISRFPEPSALWRSTDAEVWERIDTDIGAPEGQQRIFAITESDTALRAYVNVTSIIDSGENSTVSPLLFEGISIFESIDGGRSWSDTQLWPWAFGALVDSAAGDVLIGASGLDTNRPLGSSFVESSDEPGSFQRYVADLNSAGFSESGGVLRAGASSGDDIVAVGSSTVADPDRSDVVSFSEQLASIGPLDADVWISEDGGKNWDRQQPDAFAGRPGAQVGLDVTDLDGTLWMIVSDRNSDAVVDGTRLNLYSSFDGGATWSAVVLDADPDNGQVPGNILVSALQGAHLTVLDGVVLVTVNSPLDTVVSLFDPTSGESDTRSVADVLALGQVESIIAYEDQWLGFGRRERDDANASDLQTIDIHVERDTAEESRRAPGA